MEGRDAKKVGLTPPLDEYIEWLVLYLDSMVVCDWWYVVPIEICMQEEECVFGYIWYNIILNLKDEDDGRCCCV